MARINTNVQSLVAQRVLGTNNTGLGQALERLSTGLKINRGKDDPAGLIASENLRSEQKSLSQAVSNADRADQVLNIAEGGLQEDRTAGPAHGERQRSRSLEGRKGRQPAADRLDPSDDRPHRRCDQLPGHQAPQR